MWNILTITTKNKYFRTYYQNVLTNTCIEKYAVEIAFKCRTYKMKVDGLLWNNTYENW